MPSAIVGRNRTTRPEVAGVLAGDLEERARRVRSEPAEQAGDK